MARYLMTHSLLSSWLYCIKGNPYDDATSEKQPFEDFVKVLRREPTETTEAMWNGINFENLVDAIVRGEGDPEDKWYACAVKVADRVRGGVPQVKLNKEVQVNGYTLLLHGRLDWLKAGEIVDVKFTKSYDSGKYFDSTQHPMYFALAPEANTFTYLVSNGSGVWSEAYRRDETRSIIPIIADFLEWLVITGYMDMYQQYWAAK